MSAYNEYSGIKFTDLDCLVAALIGCSTPHNKVWSEADILINEGGQPLYGYRGDNRNTKYKPGHENYSPLAVIAIPGLGHPGRKNAVGGASNDIGFVKNADGEYVPMISAYDNRVGYNDCWMNALKARYLENVVSKNAAKKGYAVKKTVTTDGKISLSLTRWK